MAGLSLAASACAAPDASPPGSIPGPAEMAALRQRFSARQTIRLVGTFGRREISQPLIDSTGVRSGTLEARARRRPGFWVTADAPVEPAPAPVAWREISAVQAGHSMAGRGAIAGLFIGIGLGGALASSLNGRHGGGEEAGYRAIGVFDGTVVASVVAGATVGSMCGWRTVYPADAQPGH